MVKKQVQVGVLALQGASAEHKNVFAGLGIEARDVRTPEDLAGLTHLVIPGGESTTIRHLLDLFGLADPIVKMYQSGRLALFGTCAGAILLGRDNGAKPRRLGLMNVEVERNAYGRQTESFIKELTLDEVGPGTLNAVFIRAPKFAQLGLGVEVLARLDNNPVLVRSGRILAATFHPELSGDSRLHSLFASM